QVRGSRECLSDTCMGGAFAGMVDESNRGVMVTLQRAQISEERRDFTGDILIDPVQAHERVEDRELRLKVGDGGPQCLLILAAIEPQRWHGDDMDIEGFEVDAG